MGADTFRAIQPGDICWLLVHRHWTVFEDFLQTVTLNGNFLILELWQDGSDIGEKPEVREYLSVNTDLKTLHMVLANIADRHCRKHIEALVAADFWKRDFDRTIEQLSEQKKTKARTIIDSFESKMIDLRERTFADRKDALNLLITLCNQLDEDCETVNQLYYDK